jgi:hypothetical protein
MWSASYGHGGSEELQEHEREQVVHRGDVEERRQVADTERREGREPHLDTGPQTARQLLGPMMIAEPWINSDGLMN